MSHRNLPPVIDYKDLKEQGMQRTRQKVLVLMKEQKLSKRGLAKRSNVPWTIVHQVVTEGADIRLSTLARLARGFGVPITELL